MADSALGLISATLSRYGLSELAAWAWNQYLAGNSPEEIMLKIRQRVEYKTRFPAMEALEKAGRAITEEEYISYEQGLRALVTQYGLPQSLYGSRDYVADLLVKDISLVEAKARMELASTASLTMPLEMRTALNRLYGVTAGQLTSFWLEPDATLPMLQKQFAAATLAGEATMAGLGEVSRSTAENLVSAGVGQEQARQGLTRASYELGAKLPGEVEAGLGTDKLVSGALGVGQARYDFERRVRQRIAAFASGGSALTTTAGAGGLGTTRR
jgi:hypothetical protein